MDAVGCPFHAATPVYLFFQGDALEAAIVGIPSFLIAAAFLGCVKILYPK